MMISDIGNNAVNIFANNLQKIILAYKIHQCEAICQQTTQLLNIAVN